MSANNEELVKLIQEYKSRLEILEKKYDQLQKDFEGHSHQYYPPQGNQMATSKWNGSYH